LGATDGNGATGSLVVGDHAHAKVNQDLRIWTGGIDVNSGSELLIDGTLWAGQDSQTAGDITVRGAGSKLYINDTIQLAHAYSSGFIVEDGATVDVYYGIRVGVDNASFPIHIRGAGSSLTARSLLLRYGSNVLDVRDGAHVGLSGGLTIMNSAVTLLGSSIDVGIVPFGAQLNFINVGLGGFVHSDSTIPNLHLYFGGSVDVGGSPGVMTVSGTYIQDSGGELNFSIIGTQAGSQYSQLVVGGDLQLSGKLQFSFEDGFAPQAGQTFDVITVGGSAQLSNIQIEIQNLAPGFSYSFAPFSGGYRLTALTSGQFLLPGDFNNDFNVDAADYVVWRKSNGTSSDYNLWRANFGRTAISASASIAGTTVPEPRALSVFAVAGWAAALMSRPRAKTDSAWSNVRELTDASSK
jgi:hypothetical protein